MPDHDGHSAEYFGETRDYWYNADFIDLLARRWSLGSARAVLDVGSGVGHWGQLLARVLAPDAEISGVDPDPVWVERATERAKTHGHGRRFRYALGRGEELPFPDGTFDVVTCQTVLIHVPDPARVIREMVRVTRPGGRLVLAEPNNATSALLLGSTLLDGDVEDIVALVRFQLVCERGKAALGEGNNSLGEALPKLLSGLRAVELFMNDKTNVVMPPYASPEERALVEQAMKDSDRSFWIWSEADTRRFFLAGGGGPDAFAPLWTLALRANESVRQGILSRDYASTGGAVGYLASAVVP